MLRKTIGFIGGGRITRIMLESLQRKGQTPESVIVSDVNQEVLNALKSRFPKVTITDDNIQPAGQELVFISLHPPAIAETLSQIKSVVKPAATLISLAPKVTIDQISNLLGGFKRVIRMIPNAPTIVNQGYNPVAFAQGVDSEEKKECLALFQNFGECPEVHEANLEAYAVITAMGPTYFWFQLFELQEIAQTFGLNQEEVKTGIMQMISGSLATMYDSGLSRDEVLDLVPVKPLKEEEEQIKQAFRSRLEGIYKKLKG
jgi:pyrroline-5-carboxylate reductase